MRVAVANRVVGDVVGRTCVLVDDLIDTGGTIAGAVRVVLEAGAKDVIVAATHGVLSDPAAQRLSESGAREVVVEVNLHAGDATATIWTNDLTYDYVKENAEYST